MKKQLMWFVFGVIAGMIGVTTLSASKSSSVDGWSNHDIAQVIRLLEKIADNTAR